MLRLIELKGRTGDAIEFFLAVLTPSNGSERCLQSYRALFYPVTAISPTLYWPVIDANRSRNPYQRPLIQTFLSNDNEAERPFHIHHLNEITVAPPVRDRLTLSKP